MKIKLLIATGDYDYAEHLSDRISGYHADSFDVSVCLKAELFQDMLTARKYDIALLEPSWASETDLGPVQLPVLMWTGEDVASETNRVMKKTAKYQRISDMTSGLLQQFALLSADERGNDPVKTSITAVWSPAGGVGKTTVALAYAVKKAAGGQQTMYLNLEPFSGAGVYFPESGTSISAVFELLENNEGNVKTMLRGIRRQDSDTGVFYFNRPNNFDDINILSADNVGSLVTACAAIADELVVDLPCQCDERTRKVLGLADRVLIVTDQLEHVQAKLSQFASQHDTFTGIRARATLVANKGAAVCAPVLDSVISLPLINSANASAVCRALSTNGFEAYGVQS